MVPIGLWESLCLLGWVNLFFVVLIQNENFNADLHKKKTISHDFQAR